MSEPDISYIHETIRNLALPIASLMHDPQNARIHDRRNLDAIKASLSRFGLRSPIVVQKDEGNFIVRAGNGRMQAAQELGWTHLAATVFQEDDDDAVAFAIADNRTSELGSWDKDVLADVMRDFSEAFDFTELGWTTDEIDYLTAFNQVFEDADAEEAPSVDASDHHTAKEFDVDVADDVTMGRCPHCEREEPLGEFHKAHRDVHQAWLNKDRE